jgi:hypothetical protein
MSTSGQVSRYHISGLTTTQGQGEICIPRAKLAWCQPIGEARIPESTPIG